MAREKDGERAALLLLLGYFWLKKTVNPSDPSATPPPIKPGGGGFGGGGATGTWDGPEPTKATERTLAAAAIILGFAALTRR